MEGQQVQRPGGCCASDTFRGQKVTSVTGGGGERWEEKGPETVGMLSPPSKIEPLANLSRDVTRSAS